MDWLMVFFFVLGCSPALFVIALILRDAFRSMSSGKPSPQQRPNGQEAFMDLMQADVLRRAESMKLFERDGRIHFGLWSKWWKEPSAEKRAAMLEAFNKGETWTTQNP